MLFKNISYVDESFGTKTGSILIKDGKIGWIGKDAPPDYTGEIYDGNNKMLLPGFYNVHCHVPMTLLRGYGEGLPLDRWLNEKIFPFEEKLTAEAVYWGSLIGIAEMLKSGVVSFTDMYFFLESIVKAVDESGIKANISNAAAAFSDDVRLMDTRAGQESKWLCDHVKTLEHDRIICDAALHAEYTSNPNMVRQVAEFAKENKLRMHVHISETVLEHEACKARRGGLTPVQYLAGHGLLDSPTTAAHCVAVEDCDTDILLEKGVTVAHCPSSNLKLGSGIAPIWKLHKAGVNIGIGTDGAASNNNLNELEEVNLASILQRGALRDPMCMDIASTLQMAASNGAKSQGREDCGRIKVGNRADLIVFDMDKPHLQPVFDSLSNVLYAAQASDICLTMVDGKVLYKDGELLTIDIEKAVAEARSAQRHILSQL